jgi:hypothetical protein
MRTSLLCLALVAGLATAVAGAADQKDERAGNCNDAKSQMEYFCNGSSANDTMVAIGTACTNAKKNVEAACEGKVEKDQPYKFDDKK